MSSLNSFIFLYGKYMVHKHFSYEVNISFISHQIILLS